MPVTPISERGYANPDLLVDTEWLTRHLHHAPLRLIDCRSAEQYAAGHIPGAVSLGAAGGIPRAENGDMGTPEAFAEVAARLGIESGSKIVVYDAPGAQMGMAAWAFLYYGHTNVSVLDGGFKKWTAEGRPVSTEPGSYPTGHFHPQLAEELFCSLEHAKGAHGTANTIFWDVRSAAEYEGSEARNNARPGHVAGAGKNLAGLRLDRDGRDVVCDRVVELACERVALVQPDTLELLGPHDAAVPD